VDTLLIMKREERYRTLSSIQRYGSDLQETTLLYDVERRTLSAGVTRTEADEAETANAIIKYLAGQSEAVDESAIHEAIEARRVIKQNALRKLVREGKVSRTGAGKRGDKFHYQIAGTEVRGTGGVPENPSSVNRVSDLFETENVSTATFVDSDSELPVPTLVSGGKERL
jgi:hypothetical protein